MVKILVTIILFLSFCISKAQVNPVDSTFANEGFNIINLPCDYYSKIKIATQSNNKLVVSASVKVAQNTFDFGILRYDENGILDSTFGENGILLIDLNTSEDFVFDICVQNDNKIILAGTKGSFINRDFVLLRLNSNGSLDSQFANNGVITIDASNTDIFYSVCVQSDGKILAAGTADDKGYIFRMNEDGTLDNTFGNYGCVQLILGSSIIKDILSIANGNIMVTGTFGASTSNAFIVNFKSDGSYDTGFGTGGKYLLNTNNQEYLNTIAVQEDGKILAGGAFGYSGPTLLSYFMVMRLMPNGVPDLTFNNTGTIHLSIMENAANECNTIEIDSAGNIFACGYTGNIPITNSDMLIVKMKPNGSLDNSFGINGKYVSTLLSSFENANDSFINSEYKLVISGNSGTNINPMLCRLNTSIITPVSDVPFKYEHILIYPNPCSETLTISTFDNTEDAEITIVNLSGKIIYQDHLIKNNNKDLRINTKILQSGVYFIKLCSKTKSSVAKFIKI